MRWVIIRVDIPFLRPVYSSAKRFPFWGWKFEVRSVAIVLNSDTVSTKQPMQQEVFDHLLGLIERLMPAWFMTRSEREYSACGIQSV